MPKIDHAAIRLAVASLLLPAAPPAFAATDSYLIIKDIKGETLSRYGIESWSWGAANSPSAAAQGSVPGQPPATNASVTVVLARSPAPGQAGRQDCAGGACAAPSPQPARATNLNSSKSNREAGAAPVCSAGARYPGATLNTASGRWQLTDVVISSCSPESISLVYRKIEYIN